MGLTPQMLSSGIIMRRTLLGLFFCLFQYGRTPLHLAANNGILDVVRYLCLAGANVEALTSVSSLTGESNGKHLSLPGHEGKVIAWQLHSKADKQLLSFSSSTAVL